MEQLGQGGCSHKLGHRACLFEEGELIPRIIHYVWVGPNPLPEEDRARVESWRALLPDWEIKSWGNDNVDFSSPYLRQAFAVRAWNRVSDYVRMDALVKFGGVYLDTDVDLVKSLEPLLQESAFLGFQCDDAELPDEIVNGAIFGAEKGHWLPTKLRDHFNNKMDGREDVKAFSGPGLLTKVLRESGLKAYSDEPVDVQRVKVFPRRYFYPLSLGDVYTPDILTPDSYAVHQWAFTWSPKRKLTSRIRKKAINALAWRAPRLALQLARSSVRTQVKG